MRVLSQLEPANVFGYFEDICHIPHPSYKEEKISAFLVDFAKEHNLEYYQDELYNVIMIKEATPGYEDVPPIILQGHMDMVAEKKAGCTKNMDEEGLDLAIDGDFIYAKDTTLGGDDGIAVAYALAILDDERLEHPRLEFVCTVSEEVGMEGAAGIDVSMLKGKKLLNIDSEEEGVMLTSCAGGCSAEITLPIAREEQTGEKLTVQISDLAGGHSGVEIHKERANANCVMSRILRELNRVCEISILSWEGGRKDNAIPRDGSATIVVTDAEVVEKRFEKVAAEITKEYASSDPNLCITMTREGNATVRAVSAADSAKMIALIQALPNGVMRMSRDIEGLVETSLNLGILNLEEDKLVLAYSLRSSVDSAKESLLQQVICVAQAMDGAVTTSGTYPAWEFKKDSKLRDDMVAVYERMFGEKPVLEAVHAGLECGILSGKIAGLDCVSMGPNIYDIHTTEERLSISSTKRMYEYVTEVLRCK